MPSLSRPVLATTAADSYIRKTPLGTDPLSDSHTRGLQHGLEAFWLAEPSGSFTVVSCRTATFVPVLATNAPTSCTPQGVASGAGWVATQAMQAVFALAAIQMAGLVLAIGRAVRDTVVVATKYHLRRALGVPRDWLPPEDV
jgi:hypothetical protein